MGMLYLVRHGECTAVDERKIAGQGNFPLSLKGVKQSHELADNLMNVNIDFIYCSKVQRAIDTMNIITSKISKPSNIFVFGHNMALSEWLNARTHGPWDGVTHDEIDELFDPIVRKEWSTQFYNKSPGGESLDEMYDRVISSFYTTIYRQLQNSNDNILLVSHKRVMQALMSFLHKEPKKNMLDINVKHETVYNYLIK